MRTVLPLVVVLLVVAACSSVRPVAIKVGDICEDCHQAIQNTKLAAEIVEPNGLAMKFKTVSCMARFASRHQNEGAALFVTDYQTGKLFPVQRAVFVRGEIDSGTRALDYVAFSDVRPAVEFGRANGSSPVDWPQVLQRVAAGN